MRFAAILAVLLCAAALEAAAATKQDKEPPACAAISFRPLAAGLADGVHEAGMYKSRFARIEIMGVVKGGQAADYHMLLNGKKPAEHKGALPASVEPCLKAKNIGVPVKAVGGACVGERFRVAIDSSAKQKLLLLFALQGREWKLCSAATV
ncbi:MAG: hypothetical protein FJX68_01210 [Alphaproteobacteria bacterium]|nr:hypothetical protein [Alphaproteobacteria bacterium]